LPRSVSGEAAAVSILDDSVFVDDGRKIDRRMTMAPKIPPGILTFIGHKRASAATLNPFDI